MTSTVTSKSDLSRYRSEEQDRHNLPDPKTSIRATELWEHGMLRERVSDLFKTSQGLPGHAQQIQQQLNRTSWNRLTGLSGKHVVRLLLAVNRIIGGIKAINEASSIRPPTALMIFSPMTQQAVKITN